VPAAIAVLSEAGSVERATRAFVDRFDLRDGSFASCAHEVDLIITGQAYRLTVLLDGLEADLVAVVDRDDRRAAVLTIPNARGAADEPVSPLLEEPLDESPAIVWLKDLDGRYLRVNRRYVDQLGTDAEHVCGRTDAELTAAGSIEGLRLDEEDTAPGRELLELEYRVGAFEERPALAVLRFALRDGEGQPTATCSVAAPVAEESLARSEFERLMRIDRWGWLDTFAIREELLDEWGLTLADVRAGLEEHQLSAERVAAVVAERDEARATIARLEEELSGEREQRGSLRDESERARVRVDELDGVVAAEQARATELEQSRVRAEARASELEVELADVRAGLEEHQLSAERVAAVVAERDEARATIARLEEELSGEREQRGSLRDESERARVRVDELDGVVAAEQARATELEQSRVRAEARASELEVELADVRAGLEEHQLSAEPLDAASSAPESNGLKWGTGSQRALSAALGGLTEWRSVLTHAVGTLGSEGGWDATIAWCPDGRRGSMTCGALWMRDPAGLATFGNRTWKDREDASTAEFGRACNRMEATCVLDLQSAEDPLLRAAAAEGMGTALLVPIGDGGETIAMLALLSRTTTAPNAELMVSLEAIALQLGAIAQLLNLAAVPRWRIGPSVSVGAREAFV